MITQYRIAIPTSRKTSDDEISWNRLVGKTIGKPAEEWSYRTLINDIIIATKPLQDKNGVPFITARKKDRKFKPNIPTRRHRPTRFCLQFQETFVCINGLYDSKRPSALAPQL